jgi:hypothetical protein
MSGTGDSKTAPPVRAEPEHPKPAAPRDPPPERRPQAEEVLCTICGMRSCWR